MKKGDLVTLTDVAVSYVRQLSENDTETIYGVLIDSLYYTFEPDKPENPVREIVWKVLVDNHIHDILERDLILHTK
jgi:hypothetical protein